MKYVLLLGASKCAVVILVKDTSVGALRVRGLHERFHEVGVGRGRAIEAVNADLDTGLCVSFGSIFFNLKLLEANFYVLENFFFSFFKREVNIIGDLTNESSSAIFGGRKLDFINFQL
jgi:hypothetical protein